jgi:hypothetical protein
MKKAGVLVLTLAFTMSLAMDTALAGPRGHAINQRQHKQMDRIQNGRQSGELTRKENRKLMKGELKINRYEQKARSDGHISGKEAYRLDNLQDRQSKAIYKQKHDRQDRG